MNNYIKITTKKGCMHLYRLLRIPSTVFKQLNATLFLMTLLFMFSCSEDFNTPLENNSPAPGPVANIKVENIPGGAIITYSLPPEQSLLYVSAIVEVPNGKKYEYKSSSYSTSVTVVGLPDAAPQIVNIYSVSKSEARSNPVTITIDPLEPPYITVFNSLLVKQDFGGMNIKFDNESGAELAFVLGILKDGKFQEYGTYYSRAVKGNYTWRGLPATETEFVIYIRDRWDNFSSRKDTILTPLFEMMLDKNKFRDLTLGNDTEIYPTQGGEWNINKVNLWDGTWSTVFDDDGWWGNYLNMTTKGQEDNLPKFITIDLGQNAVLSRVRINNYERYSGRSPKKYEIWGCSSTPPADGNWTPWIKLGEFEQEKPSGLPGMNWGPGDAEAWLAGDNVDLSCEGIPYRYIRFKCIENWNGGTNFSLAETTFYGSIMP